METCYALRAVYVNVIWNRVFPFFPAGEIEKNIQEKQLPPDDPEVQKVLALYEELVKITPSKTAVVLCCETVVQGAN